MRGTPDLLNFFDAEDSKVKGAVLNIERLFLVKLGNEKCNFQFVTISKQSLKGTEFISSAEAVRLQIFNNRKKNVIKLGQNINNFV